jgi:uncharacterized protein (DUF362 family)
MKRDKITRREFLDYFSKYSIVLATISRNIFSTSWFTQKKPRRGVGNFFFSEGKPLLIIVEGKDIKKMMAKGIEALVGFKELVKSKNIVIKPNVTWSQPYPVTTDPALLEEIVIQAKTRNCGEITICDSPSSTGLHAHYIFSSLRYFELRKKQKVRVKCIDPIRKTEFVSVKNDKWKINPTLSIIKDVQYADVVINTAIPKRHHAADFSCALKNCFGCVYDTFRMYAHKNLMRNKEKGEIYFDRSLAEFADAVRPELTIIDARSILIKEGPAIRGKAEVKRGINKLILSGDIVAVESYCAQLMEAYDSTFLSKRRVAQQIKFAEDLGLGIGDLSRVKIVELKE